MTSKASSPRSYYLESQGKQYSCTQQHIHAIDINALQDHQQPVSQGHQSNKHQNNKQPVSQDHQSNKQPVSQDHQSNKQPALQDHQHTTKNNTLQDHQPKHRALQDHQPRHRALQYHQPRHRQRKVPSNRSTSMTEIQSLTVDQLLQYLIAVNGHGNIQTPNASPQTPSSPRSESTMTTSTYNSEDNSSSSDDESIASTMSDRQLRPRVPISYNETVLKKLHGQPQVRMCNNLSIPLFQI